MNHKEDLIAGRNAVIEALRAKKPIDKIFVLDGCLSLIHISEPTRP